MFLKVALEILLLPFGRTFVLIMTPPNLWGLTGSSIFHSLPTFFGDFLSFYTEKIDSVNQFTIANFWFWSLVQYKLFQYRNITLLFFVCKSTLLGSLNWLQKIAKEYFSSCHLLNSFRNIDLPIVGFWIHWSFISYWFGIFFIRSWINSF